MVVTILKMWGRMTTQNDIHVKFMHPTDGRMISVTMDNTMTPSEVIAELILNNFIPPTPNDYSLAVKGGNMLTANKTFYNDGVVDGDVIRVIKNKDSVNEDSSDYNYVSQNKLDNDISVSSSIPGLRKKTTDKFTIEDVRNSPSTIVMIINLYDDLKVKYEEKEKELEIEKLRSNSRFLASLILLVSQFILTIGVNLLTSNKIDIAIPILVAGGIQSLVGIYLTFRTPK